MTTAPACHVSYDEFRSQWGPYTKTDPRSRVQTLKDLIDSIPRAHDLQSVIKALNIINNIIMHLTRGTPAINNVYEQGRGANIILKGDDNDPGFINADWIEETRVYKKQKMINPDDPSMFIEINVLNFVAFRNDNTAARFTYIGPFWWG